MTNRRHWDQLVADRIRARNGRRSARAAFAALAVVGLVVSMLPGVAHAHFAEPGLNEAQLNLVHAGSSTFIVGSFNAQITVEGKSFIPSDVAQIFQCQAGVTDLRGQCQPVGAMATDASGGFTATVNVNWTIVTPSGTTTTCTQTQCVVAAATYDNTTGQPTSRAQHNYCFQGFMANCSWGQNDGTTTTTTAPPPSAEWEPAPPMGTARQSFATAVGSDGRIYAMGGNQNEGVGDALNSAEAFDPCRKSWSSLPPMPTPRTQFAAATGPDGRIYAIGGRDSFYGTPLATVEAYNPATNAWSTVAGLAVPRSHLAAATGPDGRIYAIGGLVGSESGIAVPTVEAYDPVTDSWAQVTPLSTPRAEHGAVTANGRISAVAGSSPLSTVKADVESYSSGPAGTPGVWQRSAARGFLDQNPAVTAGPDGLIYALGGTQPGPAVSTVNSYDPVADTWTVAPELMITARSAHGAASGRDGRIYAIGGTDDPRAVDGAKALSSVEAVTVGPNLCASLPPVADFNGDRSTDIAVYRPANSTSYFRGQTPDAIAYGAPGDIPVPGDYDGDKQSELSMFRPSNGTWYLRNQTPDAAAYGADGDIPVPADYDGDQKN